ncbi:MAG: AraC family transcriptional regulator [Oscillospiraceae bacterium]|jgi:AraC-like DNA-binding protein|nr:AraC family transcriptional regulator [Oscillospiraceae bacterium]
MIVQKGYETHNWDDIDFPISLHRDCLGENSSYRVLTHWHDDVEFLYFKAGVTNLICNQTCHTMKAGEIAFINPYSLHSLENATSSSVYICLVIRADLLEPFPFPILDSQMPIVTNNPQIIACFNKIVEEERQKRPCYQAVIQGELFAMAAYLSRNSVVSNSHETPLHAQQKNVRLAINYIQTNFRKNITIGEVCSLVGFSKTYFGKCFHKMTGKSIIEYLNCFRCERAYDLLRSGEFNVCQAAMMSGFQNMSYFTRQYKQLFGVLPSQTKGKKI